LKVVYYKDEKGNYGDELNKWLWPKLFGELISGYCLHGIEFQEENNKENLLFYGIGTILDVRAPATPKKIIFGVGTGYANAPTIDDSYAVFFVRGPLTAKALNLDASYALTDPAILLSKYVRAPHKKHNISFMPHIGSHLLSGVFWQDICQKLGIYYISPEGHDVERVTLEIDATDILITEAMHGAIVADALRVPWIPVVSDEINRFKWQDWCNSLELDYIPMPLTTIYDSNKFHKKIINKVKANIALKQLKDIIKNPKPFLSADNVSMRKIELIENKVDALKSLIATYK
jgi:succinoglycan biosynthesis protein ExoV